MKTSDAEELLEEFIKAVEKFELHTIRIFLGHPSDLFKMDMKQIPADCYFISDINAKQGEFLMVNAKDLKEDLYKFVKEHPDRVFRGRSRCDRISDIINDRLKR